MFKSFLLSSLVLGLAVQNCASTPKGKKNIAEASSSAAADESVEVSDEEKFRNAFEDAKISLEPVVKADPEIAKVAAILGVPVPTAIAIVVSNLALASAVIVVPAYAIAAKNVEEEFNKLVPGLLTEFMKNDTLVNAAKKVAKEQIDKDAASFYKTFKSAVDKKSDDDLIKLAANIKAKYSNGALKYADALEAAKSNKDEVLKALRGLDEKAFATYVSDAGLYLLENKQIIASFKKNTKEFKFLARVGRGGKNIKETVRVLGSFADALKPTTGNVILENLDALRKAAK